MSENLKKAIGSGDHLILVDGSSYIFRAYHALPALIRKADGLPIGAVSGFCNMMLKLLREQINGGKATHLAVIFDSSRITFRNEIYSQYKAHRPEAPDDLKPQFALIRDATRAFDLACIEQEGFEADDLIATYSRQACERGAKVTIVASDKDLMQLVRDGISMYDSVKDRVVDEAVVIEKFGVPPEKVIYVQALAGDSTDNVPGVPGIGVKTAAQLVLEYGDLETLLAHAHEIKQPKRREALINFAEQARISEKLVTLRQDVPVDTPLEDLVAHDPDPRHLIAFLKAMDMTTIARRASQVYDIDPTEIEPDPRMLPGGEGIVWKAPVRRETPATDLFVSAAEPNAKAASNKVDAAQSAAMALALQNAENIRKLPFDHKKYQTVQDVEQLEKWVERAREVGVVAFDTETTSLDVMQADLVGFSLAVTPGEACYVPLQHKSQDADLFGDGFLGGQIPLKDAMAVLKPLLEDESVLKIGQNMKYDWVIMKRYGATIAPFDDTMLISYVLDAGRGSHGMDELAKRHLEYATIPYSQVAGTGKNAISFQRVDLDKATAYAAEDADVTLRLHMVLKPRLVAEKLTTVYETLERPLAAVIARMEMRGISIDRNILSRLSGDFAQGMAALEAEIYELAGESFLVSSPKQTGDILFGKLGLPGAKKTATGQWATPASLLEELASAGHELPRKLLDWRQLAKLKTTYTDALPGYVNPETDRVHTSFSLGSTLTGRLASSEPNLQNIPVRSEAGRQIRKAFIAPAGHKIVSADYSQIELRVLAHMADIPQLQKAFADGQDIHAATASAMFGVPVNEVNSDLRRSAKTINFGIIYGISAFGLAQRLGIGNGEAANFIKQYFERFPGIRDYIEDIKKTCRENGYVTTLFGRVCHYPLILTGKPQERAAVERQAINAPIQGSAADIIRRAMIRMDDALKEASLSAQMLLQVHDELVFEVSDDEIDKTLAVVRKVMEQAAEPAVSLKVPLVVDARAAQNWDEAH
ncbi:DNA polymerase I [Microvirga sp. W0021]|uniref:DNA polymerase I n=1 Tax=Hohaiivirga grylli TaxID=3133970 RepID=A0ABV0BG33_9HYPH